MTATKLIAVSPETRTELKIYAAKHGFRSAGQAIQNLLDAAEESDAA